MTATVRTLRNICAIRTRASLLGPVRHSMSRGKGARADALAAESGPDDSRTTAGRGSDSGARAGRSREARRRPTPPHRAPLAPRPLATRRRGWAGAGGPAGHRVVGGVVGGVGDHGALPPPVKTGPTSRKPPEASSRAVSREAASGPGLDATSAAPHPHRYHPRHTRARMPPTPARPDLRCGRSGRAAGRPAARYCSATCAQANGRGGQGGGGTCPREREKKIWLTALSHTCRVRDER